MRTVVTRLFVMACMLLLISAAGYAETPRATVTFDNKSGNQALVKLIGPTGRTAQVPDGQSRTVKVIGGKYYIVTRYGANPDSYTYAKGNHFTVIQNARQYSVITITLHKVVDGNYQTSPISAGEFDKATP